MKQNTLLLLRSFPLFILILIDAMAFSMIAPVLSSALVDPRTAVLMTGSPSRYNQLVYGFAIAVCPLIVLFMAPLLGRISDLAGRKKVLVICCSGLVVGNFLIGAAIALRSVVALFIGRVIQGATSASQAMAQAAIVDASSPQDKSFNLSMTLLFSSFGFIMGPALGGYLSDSRISPLFGFSLPLYTVAALSLANLFFLWLLYRDKAAALPGFSFSFQDLTQGIRDFFSAFRERSIRQISLSFLFMQMAWGCFFSFVSVFLIEKHGFTSSEVASFMSILGIGFCLSYGLILPFIQKFFRTEHICFAGLLLTGLEILALVLPQGRGIMWLFPLPIAITVCFSYGTIITMFSDMAGSDRQGWVMGTTTSLIAMAWFASSFFASFIEACSVFGNMVFTAVLFLASLLFFRTVPYYGDQVLRVSREMTGSRPEQVN
ncbi:MAG: MFS transporter [Candidatus Eremiobacteraeota bacterium]|nr:MFS transporter [Candidatus Eremiobacteraeota bacterium]